MRLVSLKHVVAEITGEKEWEMTGPKIEETIHTGENGVQRESHYERFFFIALW